MVATPDTVPTVTCDGSKSGDFAFQTIPDIEATITALSLFAPMIQINWQSSDRAESSSTTSNPKITASSTKPAATKTTSASSIQITASGTQTIDLSATSSSESETLVLDDSAQTTGGVADVDINLGTDSSPIATSTLSLQEGSAGSDGNGSSSFGSGAKVAIGVTGAVAFVMVLVCALFYFWRRRQQRREEAELDAMFGCGGVGPKHTMTDGGDFTSNDEIPGWYRGQRLASAPTHDPFFRDAGGGAWGMKEVEMQVPAPAPAATGYDYRSYRP
jgi:hypothetical protein